MISRSFLINGILILIYCFELQLLKGKGTTFRITSNTNLPTNADFKLQSIQTGTYLLEWLVNNSID